jgi:cytoskeletal protein RodZ
LFTTFAVVTASVGLGWYLGSYNARVHKQLETAHSSNTGGEKTKNDTQNKEQEPLSSEDEEESAADGSLEAVQASMFEQCKLVSPFIDTDY